MPGIGKQPKARPSRGSSTKRQPKASPPRGSSGAKGGKKISTLTSYKGKPGY